MKRKKIKKSAVRKLVLLVVLILGIMFFLINYNSVDKKLERLNYSKEAIKEIKDNKLEATILKQKYSKTLDTALTSKDFDKKNLELYFNIKFNNSKDFIKNINQLAEIGYDDKEINKIFSKVNNKEVNYLTNYTYISDLKNYLDYKIFKTENLERYIKYRDENDNLSYKEIILYVNMNLDKAFYDNPKEVTNPDDLLVLVNKYNKLPEEYEAKNLELIDSKYSVKDMKLRKEAKEKFEEMCTDAKSINLIIKAVSAYRDKDYQSNLYNDYVKDKGLKMAEEFSARPRHSEHETGLAVDVMGGPTGYDLFENTKEYEWVKQNAQKYGFIVRYQQEKENITGYHYESWHLRYVGEKVATYIYENDITFDEYYALFLDN